ncbi:MAG: hypothetical protein A4E56_01269 [Pelotomaculum sp. PtaU1.Bin065]|nr:MAG: hypothetical protein A4E56_01269 [Pelotomaculum sp. PtaU1.Bin065]
MKILIRYFFEFVTFVLILLLIPLLYLLSKFRNRVRSLWSGSPIINMTVNVKAERLLGVDAITLVYDTYFITEAFDYNLKKICNMPVIRCFVPYFVFIWSCLFFDRFHFYFDRGLLPPRKSFEFNPFELSIYRFLNKQVFIWTYGADVRSKIVTEKLGEFNCCLECTDEGKACICDDARRIKNIVRVTRRVSGTFAMGDMKEYTIKSINDTFFWPVELEKYEPYFPDFEPAKTLKVVHAPNHRQYKGTKYIIEAVNQLKSEGFDIELLLVEGVPHDKAVEIYRSADIIFDQCIIGFHGYFAIEGMAMGKPVLCYIRKPDYLLYPEECPIINVRADSIKEVLRNLLLNPEILKLLGQKGRKYIEKYYTVSAFSERLKKSYLDGGFMK